MSTLFQPQNRLTDIMVRLVGKFLTDLKSRTTHACVRLGCAGGIITVFSGQLEFKGPIEQCVVPCGSDEGLSVRPAWDLQASDLAFLAIN